MCNPYKCAHYLQIPNKKQLVPYSEPSPPPHPSLKAPAILRNVLSITSLKNYRRREGGENVCLIYLVLCVSSSHHPVTEAIEKTLRLPSEAEMAKGLCRDTINLLCVWTNLKSPE